MQQTICVVQYFYIAKSYGFFWLAKRQTLNISNRAICTLVTEVVCAHQCCQTTTTFIAFASCTVCIYTKSRG